MSLAIHVFCFTAVSCPDIDRASFTDGNVLTGKTQFHLGDIAEFHCNLGFQLSGDSSYECQANGQWSPGLATITCQSRSYL